MVLVRAQDGRSPFALLDSPVYGIQGLSNWTPAGPFNDCVARIDTAIRRAAEYDDKRIAACREHAASGGNEGMNG